VERTHELEVIRRSIAMLQSDPHALGREEALRLIDELQDVEKRLDEIKDVRRFDELKAGLARLLDGLTPSRASAPPANRERGANGTTSTITHLPQRRKLPQHGAA